MAKANKAEALDPMEKIARLLAMVVVKEMKPDDAALKLDLAGFEPKEISEMLGVSDNYLHSLKNRLKKAKSQK